METILVFLNIGTDKETGDGGGGGMYMCVCIKKEEKIFFILFF